MAELTQKERLQPSLLDRLTDDAPQEKQESREKRVLSLRKLREAVLRDLSWLLNCSNLSSAHDLAAYPNVAASVLNFGVPAFGGHTLSGIDIAEMEDMIRDAIAAFEPRILRNTVRVRAVSSFDGQSHNAIAFEVEGELWAQPVSQRVFLKTELDLELGAVKISESAPSRAP